MFKNIIIIGLGLIGGSLAKACKKNKISANIYGFDIDQSQIDFALKNQIIDGIYNFSNLVDEDLIIVASPLFKYEEIFKKLQTKINNSVIIDIGSLKEFPLFIANKILGEKSENFIPCHPIAGSDKSGVCNADENLFLEKKVILTLQKNTNKNKTEKIELFWEKVGSKIEFMDAKEHDKIFALVSHLPQFLSFVAYEKFENGHDEILNRHFRLQNSNPKIWQEIFKLNRENIEYYLGFFLQNLETFKDKNLNRRKILIDAFLQIPDIKKFEKHAGSGFNDFIAIKSHEKLQIENDADLSKFLKQTKEKIINYDFS